MFSGVTELLPENSFRCRHAKNDTGFQERIIDDLRNF